MTLKNKILETYERGGTGFTIIQSLKWILKRVQERYSIYEVRPMVRHLVKTRRNKELIGVEIGVCTGINAAMIMKKLKIKKIYLIDPYTPYEQHSTQVVFDISEDFQLNTEEKAHQMMKKHKEKAIFIRETSTEASKRIEDKSLDFVYIDGLHDYENTKNDIDAWDPKVKEGGVIGGHDYHPYWTGVIKAADEYAKKNNMKIEAKGGDWWVEK
jgi:hypothetical protein